MRSHLRMTGRWRIEPRGKARAGRPWLVLRGETLEGVLWNGPVLTLETRNRPAARPGRARGRVRSRCRRRAPARRGRPVGSARRSRTSGSSPGSGTCGRPRRSGRSALAVAARAAMPTTRRCATPLAAARRLMRDVARVRPAGRQVYRHAGRPCPRCGTIIRSRGQGDAQPHRVLVPGLPGRRRAAGGVSRTDGGTRSAAAPDPARLLPRRVRLPRPRARGRRRPAVRLRGARSAAGAGALRVPAARARLRRVARKRARESRRRPDRPRRAAARARCRDLRARPRGAEADRGAGALPHRARSRS